MKKICLLFLTTISTLSWQDEKKSIDLEDLLPDDGHLYLYINSTEVQSNKVSKTVFDDYKSAIINTIKQYREFSSEDKSDPYSQLQIFYTYLFETEQNWKLKSISYTPYKKDLLGGTSRGASIYMLDVPSVKTFIDHIKQNEGTLTKEVYEGIEIWNKDVFESSLLSMAVLNETQIAITSGINHQMMKTLIDRITGKSEEPKPFSKSKFYRSIQKSKACSFKYYLNTDILIDNLKHVIACLQRMPEPPPEDDQRIKDITGFIKQFVGTPGIAGFSVNISAAKLELDGSIEFKNKEHGAFGVFEGKANLEGVHIPNNSDLVIMSSLSWIKIWESLEFYFRYVKALGPQFDLEKTAELMLSFNPKQLICNNLRPYFAIYSLDIDGKRGVVVPLQGENTEKIPKSFIKILQLFKSQTWDVPIDYEWINIDNKKGLKITTTQPVERTLVFVPYDKMLLIGENQIIEDAVKQPINDKQCLCCSESITKIKSTLDSLSIYALSRKEYTFPLFKLIFLTLINNAALSSDVESINSAFANTSQELNGYAGWKNNALIIKLNITENK
ncbi:MAG: hypothetical protein HY606_03495 [Planctomycetes bacterium]|nr:hypothetical protein [Planctomycetota bacterium]